MNLRISVYVVVALGLAGLLTVGGCGSGERTTYLSLGTAPVGGAFQPVGNALSETLNEQKGKNAWKVQPEGTKGSQENIRKLEQGKLQLALSNSAITHHAVRGEAVWDKKYKSRAVVTIAPNVAMFITKKDSGIKTIADLKGRRVVCGPAGAGFDMFIEPILEAHGVSMSDFKKLNNNQNAAVDMLADGQADAAFMGGAVPTAAVQRACNEQDVHFVPYDEAAKDKLVTPDYPFFQRVTIPKDKYRDLQEDYHGLNVGSMHLITSADQPEDRIYEITKTLWKNKDKISHPAAKFINEENAARYTGTPFHPGAVKFYKEIKIWKGESAGDDNGTESNSDTTDSDTGDTSDGDGDSDGSR